MKTKTICGRCGGTGQHQFNQVDGTMCYGCRGSGFQMIDLAARAKRQAAAAKRHAAVDVGRVAYIEAMTATKAELNAAFGPFDLSTALGIDQLNGAVARATGMNLAAHCKARLAAVPLK